MRILIVVLGLASVLLGCRREEGGEELMALTEDLPKEEEPIESAVEVETLAGARMDRLRQEDDARLAPFEEAIAARTRERLAQLVTPKGTAAELGLPWPAPSRAMDLGEFGRVVEETRQPDVDSRFPPERLEEIRAEAEKTYAPVPIGEHVAFIIRDGRGVHTRVEGRLNEVGRDFVRVGDRRIIRADIDPKDLARVDRFVGREFKERYIKRESRRFTTQRDEYRESLVDPAVSVLEGILKRIGNTYQGARVCLPSDVIKQAVDDKRGELAPTIRAEVEKDVYTKEGFVFRDGRWHPREESVGGDDG